MACVDWLALGEERLSGLPPHAVTLAADCIGRAALILGPTFPAPDHPVGGPNESVRIGWNAVSGRHVRAVFGAHRIYLYREWGKWPMGHEVEDNVTGEKLSEWLEWLNKEEPCP